MISKCKSCRKLNKETNTCEVMKELLPNCWAWTNNPDWEFEVNSQTIMYEYENKGTLNFRTYLREKGYNIEDYFIKELKRKINHKKLLKANG